jgi:hypothetical protein
MGKKDQNEAIRRELEKAAFRQAAERDAENRDGHKGRVDFLLDEKNAKKGK